MLIKESLGKHRAEHYQAMGILGGSSFSFFWNHEVSKLGANSARRAEMSKWRLDFPISSYRAF
jgi:hypothetical protein